VNEVHACGGQAKSALWCQIKADVLGRRVLVPEVLDAAVVGAAIIAGVGVGVFESFTRGAQEMVRLNLRFDPDGERHTRYASLYERYRALYPAVKKLYVT
jgi:sugar (pentulose or hexulose) kinase